MQKGKNQKQKKKKKKKKNGRIKEEFLIKKPDPK